MPARFSAKIHVPQYSRALTLVVLALTLASCSKNPVAVPTRPTSERPRLERAEPLPERARDHLRKYMVEHGDSMESLLWSALMLEHPLTEVVVQQILRQPRLSRPDASGSGDTRNDWLPERFYELQDQMFNTAEELRLAAAQRDDIGTARAYAKLTETCVTCHSLYLSLPGQAGEPL